MTERERVIDECLAVLEERRDSWADPNYRMVAWDCFTAVRCLRATPAAAPEPPRWTREQVEVHGLTATAGEEPTK